MAFRDILRFMEDIGTFSLNSQSLGKIFAWLRYAKGGQPERSMQQLADKYEVALKGKNFCETEYLS